MVAFVLSGGASLGAIQAGMLRALYERGIVPELIVGTSAGANGRPRRLSRGDMLAAVLASAAIPGVYPPVSFEGADLVDGGVANNTPISDAAQLGATKIYVLPTGITCELPNPPSGAVAMLVHAITLLVNQRLAEDIERFSDAAELIVLPPPCPLDVFPSDFGRASLLIEQGHKLASIALDHSDPAGYWTPRSLEPMQPHSH